MGEAGPMRQVIIIEQRTSNLAGAVEPQVVWLHVATRRAEKVQTPGREVFSAAERSGRVPTVFRIRHPRADFDVLPQMRITHDGKLYNLLAASDPDGLKVDLILTCDELVNEPTT